jgi:vacuolar-type H+-ATPase subunit B/Vma2
VQGLPTKEAPFSVLRSNERGVVVAVNVINLGIRDGVVTYILTPKMALEVAQALIAQAKEHLP